MHGLVRLLEQLLDRRQRRIPQLAPVLNQLTQFELAQPQPETAVGPLDLICDWDFSQHVVIGCLATFAFFIYIGGSSFVLQTVYGISPSMFAIVFSTDAAVMVVGMVGYRLTVTRYGSPRLRAIGVVTAAVGAIALAVVAVAGPGAVPGLAVPWVLLAIVTGAMGLIFPATTTLAQQAGDRARGTASSLQGGLAFVAAERAALASRLTGSLRVLAAPAKDPAR
jgi:DHA1 family bicyclomycin/chloramphenicol resistance-like MFS transporter